MTSIRVIDFETSGLEPPEAKVVEYGFCDLVRETVWSIAEPCSGLCGGVEVIPPEVRAVHHITLEMLAGEPAFNPEALKRGEDIVVFAAHNAEFEGKFFTFDRPVICTYKAALRLYPEAPSHSNGALRYWLQDQGQIELDRDLADPAHRAGPDAYVTAHILKAMLSLVTAKQMVLWSREPKAYPRVPFGKHRGLPWAEVEGSYLDWMGRQADLDSDAKYCAARELERRRAA